MMLDEQIQKNELISALNDSHELKPISNRHKREPLPMRLRALPPSFWQQPNQPNALPTSMYLPPLFKSELDTTYATEQEISASHAREVRISHANTDLLFKLFDSAEQSLVKDGKKSSTNKLKVLGNRPLLKCVPKAFIRSEDPCIVDAVTEGLFPQLSLKSTDCLSSNGLSNSSPLLSAASNGNGLSILFQQQQQQQQQQNEQNFSQVLSEIVAAL